MAKANLTAMLGETKKSLAQPSVPDSAMPSEDNDQSAHRPPNRTEKPALKQLNVGVTQDMKDFIKNTAFVSRLSIQDLITQAVIEFTERRNIQPPPT